MPGTSEPAHRSRWCRVALICHVNGHHLNALVLHMRPFQFYNAALVCFWQLNTQRSSLWWAPTPGWNGSSAWWWSSSFWLSIWWRTCRGNGSFSGRTRSGVASTTQWRSPFMRSRTTPLLATFAPNGTAGSPSSPICPSACPTRRPLSATTWTTTATWVETAWMLTSPRISRVGSFAPVCVSFSGSCSSRCSMPSVRSASTPNPSPSWSSSTWPYSWSLTPRSTGPGAPSPWSTWWWAPC